MGHRLLFGNHVSNGWKNRLQWSRLGLGLGDAGGGGVRSMELIESYLDPLSVGDLSDADRCWTQINERQLAGHMQNGTSYLLSLLQSKTVGFKRRGRSKFGFESSVFRAVEFFSL